MVRNAGVFTSMRCYAVAVERLLRGNCGLEVVHAKDRLANGGNSYGYRDMVLYVRLPDRPHVSQLQLQLKPIMDLKSAAHKTYGLLRAVGWEEDEFEVDEVAADGASSRIPSLGSSAERRGGGGEPAEAAEAPASAPPVPSVPPPAASSAAWGWK